MLQLKYQQLKLLGCLQSMNIIDVAAHGGEDKQQPCSGLVKCPRPIKHEDTPGLLPDSDFFAALGRFSLEAAALVGPGRGRVEQSQRGLGLAQGRRRRGQEIRACSQGDGSETPAAAAA